MVGDCQLCKLSDICKYIYAECCPYNEKKQIMEKKVLTLTVSKQWFDMIAAGEKTEEYLEIKPYWIKRLTTNCEVAYDVAEKTYCGNVLYRPYTNVLFINGYRKDSPRIEKDIESITIVKPKKSLCPEFFCH